MNNADWILGLEDFSNLFAYLPDDVVTFILAVLMVLLILAIRRVLF